MANLSNINNKFLVTTGGNVLIGTTADNGSGILQLSGAAVSQYITSTSGSQATLFIGRSIDTQAKFTSGDVAASDLCLYTGGSRRLVILSSGYVGIGIDDPSAKLEVKENLYVSHPTSEAITFRLDNYGINGSDAGSLLRLFNEPGTTVVNIDSRSGSSRDTYFNQGGNFGIGTVSPNTGKLVVKGVPYVVTNSGQAIGGIDITSNASGANTYSGAISFGSTTSGRAAIAGVQESSDADTQGLAFFTHGSGTGAADADERMRITRGGDVGIGYTPQTRGAGWIGLDLGGTTASEIGGEARTRFTSNIYYNGTSNIYKNDYGGLSYYQDAVSISHIWYTAPTGIGGNVATLTERMRIDAAGMVGIGIIPGDGFGLARLSLGTGAVANEIISFASASGGNAELRNTSSTGTFTFTNSDGSSEKMRISSSGNVGIGYTNPSYKFQVLSNKAVSLNIGCYVNSQGPSTTNTAFYADASQGTSNNWAFYAASGNSYFANGIRLGGNGSSNELDDYEEGTFTPVLTRSSGGAISATYTTQEGNYIKIGSIVYIQIFINISAIASQGSGYAILTGLPFSSLQFAYTQISNVSSNIFGSTNVQKSFTSSQSMYFGEASITNFPPIQTAYSVGLLRVCGTYRV